MPLRPILSALLCTKTGAILIALQVAISLALLANAMQIVGQRFSAAARPSGVRAEASLLYLHVHHLIEGSRELQLARQQTELAVLRALGGATSVAMTNQMPMARGGWTSVVSLNREQRKESAQVSVYMSPGGLAATLGLQLSEGRDLAAADLVAIDAETAGRSPYPDTLLITRGLAKKLWPGASSVIGRTVYLGTGANAHPLRVVGVVDTLQTIGAEPGEQSEMSLILPMRLNSETDPVYVVRAEPGQRDRLMKEAEQALRRTSPTPMLIFPGSVDQDRANRYRDDLALAWLLVAVGVLLLLVTASGIVGMASLWVTQRRKQIGVRRALGARKRDILAYFIAENAMITTLGVAVGVLLALGLSQQLVIRLHMERLSLGYLAAGAAVFWALGALAALGPAWRAAATPPAIATRSA